MKKLMIAAAAAMAGSATFGALCSNAPVGQDSCSVYNIKFTFKTLAAKTACKDGAKWLVSDRIPGTFGVWGAKWYRNGNADDAAKALAGNNAVTVADYVAAGRGGTTVCANGNNGLIVNAAYRRVFWMDNATRKFEGIAWQCFADCFEGWFEDCDPNNNSRLDYVIWEKKNSLAVSYPVWQLKYGEDDGTRITGTPNYLYFSLDAQNEMFIGRYGKKAQKVAAYWTPSLLHGQSIDAAGFGTYDVKNLRTKSISGNAVGMIMPISTDVADACGNKNRIFCALGFMCFEWKDWCCDGCYAGVDLVPASGTWSMKYNASATKKANANKATLADFVPAYMFYSHSDWAAARNADPWLHNDNCYWWGSTTPGLLYRENQNADDIPSDDEILDTLANGARQVIDIVFDGVKSTEKVEEPVLDDNGDPVMEEDGVTPKTKTVAKSYITYGEPTYQTVPVLDENGDPVMEDDGETPKMEIVEVEPKYEVKNGTVILPDELFLCNKVKSAKQVKEEKAAAEAADDDDQQ